MWHSRCRELSRLIDRFLPDVRIVSSTVPRPTLTPARGHSTGPTRTHSTVPVPLRGPLPPSLATTSSGTPLTPTHYPSYPPPSREAGASHGGGRDYERGDRDVRDRDLAVQVLANQVQELSGLVRQVLEGDRDRGRGRHRSASSGRVRERRSRSRRRVPSPRTPPSIPPPRTPPTPPRPPVRHPYDVKGISWKGSFSTSCMSLMDRPIAGTSTRTFCLGLLTV